MAALVSLRLAAAAVLVCLAWTMPAQSVERPPPAYRQVAHKAGVPPDILFAVALQESGVNLRGRRIPWPWTLNVAGEPRRFNSRAAACASLRNALGEVPPTRVDAGLGQINVGYQRQRFNDPCELLDPYRNLAIAAAILREHYTPGEDWLVAAGRYHRPAGGEAAARYRRSVHQHLSRIREESVSVTAPRRLVP